MAPSFRRIGALFLLLSVAVSARLALPVGPARPALVRDAAASDVLAVASLPGIEAHGDALDRVLAAVLREHGFSGTMERSLERRLGRRVDRQLADLGRLLWFDTLTGLNDDNSCAGCHAPTAGFGDTQSIAIGIDNNGVVGPSRTGPRNQRRAPIVINNVFYPNLMWNSRFAALSDDPFDNSAGFRFPEPEGLTLSALPHLLTAQAFIPPTERNEVAGFDFVGDNHAIRAEVLRRLNDVPQYRALFGRSFREVRRGGAITFEMFGAAIAEFEFTLAFTDAPIDRFARGDRRAMAAEQKRGALLFFGAAGCVGCHAVSGRSNEMFSDFETHVIGVPQIVPDETNSLFDGPGEDEDFGLEQVTLDARDRYRFRTSPLRNLAVQPSFFHNGAFTRLEDAVRHHLDVFASARGFDPAGLDPDLRRVGPIEPVLARVDERLASPIRLTEPEIQSLVAFVRDGLLDPRVRPEHLARLIPARVPSGRPVMRFEPPVAAALVALEPAEPGGDRAGAAPAIELALEPNPFVARAVVRLALARPGHARVTVLDVAGRRVATLNDGPLEAGRHALAWDGRDAGGRVAGPGVYVVRAETPDGAVARRLVRTR